MLRHGRCTRGADKRYDRIMCVANNLGMVCGWLLLLERVINKNCARFVGSQAGATDFHL